MADKPDDLNLPTAVVTRIIKDVLPQGCNVAKEAKLALTRAASVFVLYLTAQANSVATERNKKTITDRDVLEALQIAEFGRFEDVLTEALDQYRQAQKSKKEKKQSKDGSTTLNDEDEAEGDVEVDAEAGDPEDEDVDVSME